jgi:hypothetical protein
VKRIAPFLILAALAGLLLAENIPQNTTKKLTFFLGDGNAVPMTGKTVVPFVSKDGGAFAAAAGACSEIGKGYYTLNGTAADADTLDSLIIEPNYPGGFPGQNTYWVDRSIDPNLAGIAASILTRASEANAAADFRLVVHAEGAALDANEIVRMNLVLAKIVGNDANNIVRLGLFLAAIGAHDANNVYRAAVADGNMRELFGALDANYRKEIGLLDANILEAIALRDPNFAGIIGRLTARDPNLAAIYVKASHDANWLYVQGGMPSLLALDGNIREAIAWLDANMKELAGFMDANRAADLRVQTGALDANVRQALVRMDANAWVRERYLVGLIDANTKLWFGYLDANIYSYLTSALTVTALNDPNTYDIQRLLAAGLHAEGLALDANAWVRARYIAGVSDANILQAIALRDPNLAAVYVKANSRYDGNFVTLEVQTKGGLAYDGNWAFVQNALIKMDANWSYLTGLLKPGGIGDANDTRKAANVAGSASDPNNIADTVWRYRLAAASGVSGSGAATIVGIAIVAPTGTKTIEGNIATAGGIPIQGVMVEISTDNKKANVIRVDYTDAFGYWHDIVNPGTYFVWTTKSGYSFSNPTTKVIAP